MLISYLLFGDNKVNYQQAYWSALSFMGQMAEEDKLVILTDHPKNFGWIGDQVELIVVDGNKLREWRGKYDFFWRIKIKALQRLAKTFPGEALLYLDADTFLKGKLRIIREMLDNGSTLMHLREGELHKFKAKTTKHMWKRLRNKEYGTLPVNKQSYMWNAGLVGLPPQKHKRLDLALQICDEMCRDVDRRRLLEQFSLSLALDSENDLLATEQQVHHYWDNKKYWNKVIQAFILDVHLQGHTLEEQIEAVEGIIESK